MSEVSELWSVVTKEGKTLLKGLEQDAREFVEKNFPWLHAQPGTLDEPTPDVSVKSPDGTEATFDKGGAGWSDADAAPAATPAEPAPAGSDLLDLNKENGGDNGNS